MEELAAKRVYADREGDRTLLVAASPGLVTIAVSGGRVGSYGVAHACAPTDVAVGDGSPLVVGTDSTVLVSETAAVADLEDAGFGPASAVSVHEGRPLASGPDGRIAALGEDGWIAFGELPSPATAMAGGLVGTAEGVIRVIDGDLRPAGLSGVTDVALAAGLPIAATAEGLYELGNGWLDVLDGSFDLVVGAVDGRAVTAGESGVYDRADGVWRPLDLPTGDAVVAAAHGHRRYLCTDAGDLLIEDADGWTRHPLGLDRVVAAVGG